MEPSNSLIDYFFSFELILGSESKDCFFNRLIALTILVTTSTRIKQKKTSNNRIVSVDKMGKILQFDFRLTTLISLDVYSQRIFNSRANQQNKSMRKSVYEWMGKNKVNMCTIWFQIGRWSEETKKNHLSKIENDTINKFTYTAEKTKQRIRNDRNAYWICDAFFSNIVKWICVGLAIFSQRIVELQ